ncbi:MAG: hypothetical protein K9J77_08170 [Rhodoferax sp.]|nr:hypothetical protein [Rhodoferax sp.]
MITKNTAVEFIEVDLQADEKKLILEVAEFWVTDETSLADLKNSRKKWVRFTPFELPQLIGELSYLCNRCKSAAKAEFLDGLASHLENALSANQR